MREGQITGKAKTGGKEILPLHARLQRRLGSIVIQRAGVVYFGKSEGPERVATFSHSH